MSTEESELPEEEGARSWADRAAGIAGSARSLVATRLAIFGEELSGKATLLARGFGAVAVAAVLVVGVLLLFAALLAAILAQLFKSVPLGILVAMLIYAGGAFLLGRVGWTALSAVKPKDFPVTRRELGRDWDAIRESLTAEPEEEGEAAEDGIEPDEGEVEALEARLRGEPQ